MKTTARMLSQPDELKFIGDFIRQNKPDGDFWNQLRTLWTAYCLHQSAPVGSGVYGHGFGYLWDTLQETDSAWASRENFEEFLSAYLC